MRMHTFSGATSREVLQKVKQALGDDALILSNREIAGGIEVVALAAADAEMTPVVPRRAEAPREIAPARWANVLDSQPEFTAPRPSHAPPPPLAHSTESLEGILTEIQSLKSMLRQDIATVAAAERAEPIAATPNVFRELLNAGFSLELARRLTAPSNDATAVTIAAVAQRLQGMIRLAAHDEVITHGGVYALVGPTGVGKTTTVAKLAARCVVRFGAAKVALLTTDSYRIGAYDQLRIYARILGVAVHAVRDGNELATALHELSGRHLVLIDTIGMSQRDRMLAEQATTLAGSGEVKHLLCVQTTTNTSTLEQIVSVYKQAGMDGCILTKTDEAANLAPALDAVVRHELPVHYITDGQRVPEDLQLPDAAALVREALQPAGEPAAYFAAHEVSDTTKVSVAPVGCESVAVEQPGQIQHVAFPKVMRPLGRHAQVRVVHG